MRCLNLFTILLALLCSYKYVQGYHGTGSHDTGTHSHSGHHGGIHSGHGVVSKRSQMNKPTTGIPQPILILDEFIIDALPLARKDGKDSKMLQRIMKDISMFAERILQQSGVYVKDEDIQKIISETISESVSQLSGVTDYKPPRLHFALVLLQALRDKIYTDPSKMYQTVGAIQETAMAIDSAMEDTSPKRETTVGAHAETGPHGHSGGISASHTTSGGTSYGGHIDHGPGGTSGGLSASHTWSHGDGSKTSLGGYVDHSHWGGTSG